MQSVPARLWAPTLLKRVRGKEPERNEVQKIRNLQKGKSERGQEKKPIGMVRKVRLGCVQLMSKGITSLARMEGPQGPKKGEGKNRKQEELRIKPCYKREDLNSRSTAHTKNKCAHFHFLPGLCRTDLNHYQGPLHPHPYLFPRRISSSIILSFFIPSHSLRTSFVDISSLLPSFDYLPGFVGSSMV